jgi:hypothetical protein
MKRAVAEISLALQIQTVFGAITTSSMAHITIGEIPLIVQLPLNHVSLLRNDEDIDVDDLDFVPDVLNPDIDDDPSGAWEDELQFGWKMPPLKPWKTLLLADGAPGPVSTKFEHEDRDPEEMLRKFVAIINPTLSYDQAVSGATVWRLITFLLAYQKLLLFSIWTSKPKSSQWLGF